MAQVANACLRPVVDLAGVSVTTTEGLGDKARGYHPVQSCLAKANGSQCGYCSPGMVMAMYGLLASKAAAGAHAASGGKPSLAEVEYAVQGNLCRCTGYRAIYTGLRQAANADDVADAGGRGHAESNGTKAAAMHRPKLAERQQPDGRGGGDADEDEDWELVEPTVAYGVSAAGPAAGPTQPTAAVWLAPTDLPGVSSKALPLCCASTAVLI
eukprot:SAG22_NODE_371_length_11566_cov_5.447458_13_plen_212_part_00